MPGRQEVWDRAPEEVAAQNFILYRQDEILESGFIGQESIQKERIQWG